MYFKDGVYAQQQSFAPKMVSSVRAPLLPEGYYGDDAGPNASLSFQDVVGNPWYIGAIVVIVILFVWYMTKK